MRQPTETASIPSVATILGRAPEMKGGEIPLEGARFILDLGIRAEDQARMLDLLARNQEAKITAEEAKELESYMLADDVLSLLKIKALIVMKKHGVGA